MKKTLNVTLIILLIALIIAYFTKPSNHECMQEAKYFALKEMERRAEGSTILFRRLTDKIIERGISIEDQILYKEIYFSYDGNTRKIGTAFFGNVILE